ncbi:hypothetical protein QTL95_06230 [Rhizobium sp. S152]|uniref:hypothetical protein n=1 Tax=Rhizobium sp. S152 TaxID=3055038 RepID=UPI0025A9B04F|nr:hypothetical protein [Rhizobium sp. S152]MDM9625483.1 hypothetical protein [Rhizobium sp. S152]
MHTKSMNPVDANETRQPPIVRRPALSALETSRLNVQVQRIQKISQQAEQQSRQL